MLNYVISIITGIPETLQLIAAGLLIVGGAFNRYGRSYATYILTNPQTGQVYIGRTSSFGDIEVIVRRRMYNHKYYKLGFTEIELDRAMQGVEARIAIRGREQLLIDYYGGISHPKVANKIRAVAEKHRRKDRMYMLAEKNFGVLSSQI